MTTESVQEIVEQYGLTRHTQVVIVRPYAYKRCGMAGCNAPAVWSIHASRPTHGYVEVFWSCDEHTPSDGTYS